MKRKTLLALGIFVFIGVCSPLNVSAAAGTEAAQTAVSAESGEISELSEEDMAMLYEMFDAEYYAKRYPDILALVGNDPIALFNNFISEGLKEGRQVNSEFNVSVYRSAYSDLASSFGKDVMSYYRHYNTVGKAEGRTITTVSAARTQGIIVTTFSGEHIAEDASGNLVSGIQADKIIASDPSYANAVDNIGGMTVDAIRQEVAASEAAATESAAASNTSSEDNKAEEAELDARVARYNAAHAEWEAAKPDKSAYVKNGKYATKEEAEAAYAADHTTWSNSKPEVVYDKNAYNTARTEWQNKEPKLTDYGLKKITTASGSDTAELYVLADKVDSSVAITVNINNGYARINDKYYKSAADVDAYKLDEGYAKTLDGTIYSTVPATDADAYTVIPEVLKSGYTKQADGTYIKIVDGSEATRTEAVATPSYNVLNDGYIEIGGKAYRKATADEAYAKRETINDGYLKTDDGIFYKNSAAAESDAYTITKEELNSGYFKDNDSYKKIVDKSDAIQEVSGYSTYDLNGTTVYYYSDDRLDIQKNENEIFASRESQRTDVVQEDGFYYDPKNPEYEEDGMSREDFEKLIGWGGTVYNATKYYIWDDGSSKCYLYKKLTYNDITIPEVLQKGVIRNENGEYYKYRDEPETEIKNDYYLDETNNRYYTDATQTEAVAIPYSKVLKSDRYVEVEGTAYKIVTADEAATYTRVLNEDYVEDNGTAYAESTKDAATTESLNDGYVTAEENGETVYYEDAADSTNLNSYNSAVKSWNGEEPEQTDYVSDEYTSAEEAWEQKEPNANSDDYSYGVTGYETQEEADAAYAEDVAEWSAEEPQLSDF